MKIFKLWLDSFDIFYCLIRIIMRSPTFSCSCMCCEGRSGTNANSLGKMAHLKTGASDRRKTSGAWTELDVRCYRSETSIIASRTVKPQVGAGNFIAITHLVLRLNHQDWRFISRDQESSAWQTLHRSHHDPLATAMFWRSKIKLVR
jgi:hypothetical protein